MDSHKEGDRGSGKQKKVKIVFVIGGPGSGKGTQCKRIAQQFGYTSYSMIQKIMKEGKLVPSDVTVRLLQQAMQEMDSDKFLIDGFPRNEENVQTFENLTKMEPEFVLLLDCPQDEMERRLLSRNEGREDDNIETIRKRFKVFMESTLPAVEYYESKGKLRKVDAGKSIDEVFESVKAIFSQEKIIRCHQADTAVRMASKGNFTTMSSSQPSDPSTASCTPNTVEKVLADGVPRKLAILGSTLFLSFVNYTGLTIVGYVGVALGVISLSVALGVKNQQLKQLATGPLLAILGESVWNEGDEELLRKMMGKNPVGKPGRWEAIADGFNGRFKVESVIKKAKELGEKKMSDEDSYSRFLKDRKPMDKRSESGNGGDFENVEAKKAVESWSSGEDLALLNALKTFPKEVAMRWEKIAAAVPGKNKAACMKRMTELKKDFRSSKSANDEA
ncbi:hypothetical protein K7X08_027857 [Anisodus acutangulus]|uniref:adenylate kinase n=1 Tax=Anisodus acutangulus TaxID=402998 RepID=A0A9Q1MUN8_9SOLA|nr:hypothetical protein K7X08_027857 [Anisodus acutangulus]